MLKLAKVVNLICSNIQLTEKTLVRTIKLLKLFFLFYFFVCLFFLCDERLSGRKGCSSHFQDIKDLG